jgi:hypothetical protein
MEVLVDVGALAQMGGVLAQVSPPTEVISVPTGVLLVAALLYAKKHKGADVPGILLGLAVGVNGAQGWVGQIVSQLTVVVVDLVTKVIQALPLH